ncbi:hypothetical protein CEXT_388571 [Caerostris extrusa]|uniref:Uncharacterized protein n=1 Tax=Caerostris extrusa TaxID=172846 RepID=A0AAV4WBV0_CAEEX|nr:hypothetical protein CEXT_388571 [Caerostris extrusa]
MGIGIYLHIGYEYCIWVYTYLLIVHSGVGREMLVGLVDCNKVRSAEDTRTLCSMTTPCGWEIYKPYIRTIEYFMKSPCDCPSGTHCARSSDDISISAFVYRCSPSNGDES